MVPPPHLPYRRKSVTSTYTEEMLREAVINSVSYAGVLRYLGVRQAGGSQSHFKRRIESYGIDTTHFTGKAHNKGKISNQRLTPEEILVVMPEGSRRQQHHLLKRALIESGVKHQCGIDTCPSPEPVWGGMPLTLQVDHADCNYLNNLIDNLRFICPNCHSQLSCR